MSIPLHKDFLKTLLSLREFQTPNNSVEKWAKSTLIVSASHLSTQTYTSNSKESGFSLFISDDAITRYDINTVLKHSKLEG